MMRHGMGTIDRRLALGGGLAAAAGLAWPKAQIRRRVVTQRGIAGGGTVAVEGGEAHFSLVASSFTLSEDDGEAGEEIFSGSVSWVDSHAGITLESTAITLYENLNLDQGEGRRIRGMMGGGGDGPEPFVLDVIARGDPGSAEDELSLVVGVAAGVDGAATPEGGFGFSYSAAGAISAGDVQNVDVEIDLESGTVSQAPAAG